MLFWRGRLSVSSKQGNVKLCLPAFRVWEVWVGKDWRRFQGLIAVNEFVQWLRRGVGKLLLAASSAITAALAKMELDATLINRSSRNSPEKSASVYECLRFTWPKNRLSGS